MYCISNPNLNSEKYFYTDRPLSCPIRSSSLTLPFHPLMINPQKDEALFNPAHEWHDPENTFDPKLDHSANSERIIKNTKSVENMPKIVYYRTCSQNSFGEYPFFHNKDSFEPDHSLLVICPSPDTENLNIEYKNNHHKSFSLFMDEAENNENHDYNNQLNNDNNDNNDFHNQHNIDQHKDDEGWNEWFDDQLSYRSPCQHSESCVDCQLSNKNSKFSLNENQEPIFVPYINNNIVCTSCVKKRCLQQVVRNTQEDDLLQYLAKETNNCDHYTDRGSDEMFFCFPPINNHYDKHFNMQQPHTNPYDYSNKSGIVEEPHSNHCNKPCNIQQSHNNHYNKPCSTQQLHNNHYNKPCSTQQLHNNHYNKPCSTQQLHNNHYNKSYSTQKSHNNHYNKPCNIQQLHNNHYNKPCNIQQSHINHYNKSSSTQQSHNNHYIKSCSTQQLHNNHYNKPCNIQQLHNNHYNKSCSTQQLHNNYYNKPCNIQQSHNDHYNKPCYLEQLHNNHYNYPRKNCRCSTQQPQHYPLLEYPHFNLQLDYLNDPFNNHHYHSHPCPCSHNHRKTTPCGSGRMKSPRHPHKTTRTPSPCKCMKQQQQQQHANKLVEGNKKKTNKQTWTLKYNNYRKKQTCQKLGVCFKCGEKISRSKNGHKDRKEAGKKTSKDKEKFEKQKFDKQLLTVKNSSLNDEVVAKNSKEQRKLYRNIKSSFDVDYPSSSSTICSQHDYSCSCDANSNTQDPYRFLQAAHDQNHHFHDHCYHDHHLIDYHNRHDLINDQLQDLHDHNHRYCNPHHDHNNHCYHDNNDHRYHDHKNHHYHEQNDHRYYDYSGCNDEDEQLSEKHRYPAECNFFSLKLKKDQNFAESVPAPHELDPSYVHNVASQESVFFEDPSLKHLLNTHAKGPSTRKYHAKCSCKYNERCEPPCNCLNPHKNLLNKLKFGTGSIITQLDLIEDDKEFEDQLMIALSKEESLTNNLQHHNIKHKHLQHHHNNQKQLTLHHNNPLQYNQLQYNPLHYNQQQIMDGEAFFYINQFASDCSDIGFDMQHLNLRAPSNRSSSIIHESNDSKSEKVDSHHSVKVEKASCNSDKNIVQNTTNNIPNNTQNTPQNPPITPHNTTHSTTHNTPTTTHNIPSNTPNILHNTQSNSPKTPINTPTHTQATPQNTTFIKNTQENDAHSDRIANTLPKYHVAKTYLPQRYVIQKPNFSPALLPLTTPKPPFQHNMQQNNHQHNNHSYSHNNTRDDFQQFQQNDVYHNLFPATNFCNHSHYINLPTNLPTPILYHHNQPLLYQPNSDHHKYPYDHHEVPYNHHDHHHHIKRLDTHGGGSMSSDNLNSNQHCRSYDKCSVSSVRATGLARNEEGGNLWREIYNGTN